MHELIENLKDRQLIWQGQLPQKQHQTISTGFPLLDQKLDGGFPVHGVIEIESQNSIGELRLMLPHIKYSQANRMVVFINPPGIISSEFFSSQNIPLHNILVINTQSEIEALWTAEQCLKSGACNAVFLWGSELEIHQTKRLQVASETGKCLQFIFKSTNQNHISLPVSLSMKLSPHQTGLEITIVKRKGAWSYGTFVLGLESQWPDLTLNEQNTDASESATVLNFPLAKQG
ncbi:translesion DNA synthesis-associated protein ImuA [Vibrio sp. T187]|uniref:translesion DNA synthesis-associated protein ImuA n=1 Tax=Vibrio TaxID=662 RepID=UPI0010C9B872|nr:MULTISPECIES: translesion DNA synthesis-associated protein ImuA [Vibrio]MBW3696568.1 translesion DNA synthesis-associated protein ImuA [Vibrio sp. T187]